MAQLKTFRKQLTLLLWKNFTLRKRQYVRNIIEVVWPLAIFIILVSVRNKRPPENVPIGKYPMHYIPRALPSAGQFMFIQSLFCDYRVQQNYSEPQDIGKVTKSPYFKIFEDLIPLLNNKTKRNGIMNFTNDLQQLQNMSRQLSQDINNAQISMRDLLGSGGSILLMGTLGLNKKTADILMNSNIQLKYIVDDVLMVSGNGMDFLNNQPNIAKAFKDELCKKGKSLKMLQLPADTTNKAEVIKELCDKLTVPRLLVIFAVIEGRQLTIRKKIPVINKVENTIAVLRGKYETIYEDFRDESTWVKLLEDFGRLMNSSRGKGFTGLSQFHKMEAILCGKKFEKQDVKVGKKFEKQDVIIIKANTNSTPSTTSKTTTSKATTLKTTTSKETSTSTTHITTMKKNQSTINSNVTGGNVTNGKVCQHHKQRFMSLLAQGGRHFRYFFSTILEGKIYYTPINNKTNTVIQRIKDYIQAYLDGFKKLEYVGPIIDQAIATIKYLEDNPDSLKELDNLIARLSSSEVGRNLPISKQLQAAQIQRLRKYIQGYNETDFEDIKKQLTSFNKTINQFKAIVDCYNVSDFFQAVETEEGIVDIAKQSNKQHRFLSSIVFLNLEDDKPFPEKIEYKLRYNPDFVPSTKLVKTRYWRAGPGPKGKTSLWWYKYINFGFVFMQDLVERSFIEIITNKTVSEPGIYIQQFPYPCYIRDQFIAWLGNFMPLFVTMMMVFGISMMIKSIVYEKELRLKEVMKVMGLGDFVHWCAWFITNFVVLFFISILLILLLKYGDILIYSDPFAIMFVLSINACAAIAKSFLISVFFSRANIAAACGGIIYFFTYLPYPLTVWFEDEFGYTAKSIVSLLSTTAFGITFKYISRWEEQGVGLQWSNFYKNAMPTDTFSVGTTIHFLILDTFLYLLLTWYFSHVFPGEYGIPKPWYFPIAKLLKLARRRNKKTSSRGYNTLEDDVEMEDESKTQSDHCKIEKEPNLEPGIDIKNLRKIYSNKKVAVENLNLKFYKGQISALLGHNGAGKSTTISILTGLFPPTSGDVTIEDKSIQTDIDEIRKSLGLCPQHNVLFDNLTVEEHMWFYGQLKGLHSKTKLKQEMEKFLIDVGLTNKKSEYSRNLSGGMKRKLSVAMAFIADSRTVILDEPTSGVDPYSRRGIWDLVLKYKHDRTILLSTHYMDEADLLGDRISIISEGVLQCSGTSLFLKRQFGKGYSLTITKDMDDTSGSFKHEEITKFISSFVSGAKLLENFESELSYVMPSAARLTGEFSNLFENLEKHFKEFGIKHYGISDTTLEEVFLNASNEKETDVDESDRISLSEPACTRGSYAADNVSLASYTSENNLILPDEDSYKKLDNEIANDDKLWGPWLWSQQFLALITKRFNHARRSKKGFFSQILLPAIFVICAMGVSMIKPATSPFPSLKLTPNMFGEPNYIVVDDVAESYFSSKLMKSFVGHSKQKYFVHNNKTKYIDESSSCSCSSGSQKCSSYPPKPQHIVLDNQDIVYDITGGNMSDYLLKTTNQYTRMRHGAASFGERIVNLPADFIDVNQSLREIPKEIGVHRNVKIWFNHKTYHALPTYINMMNNAILKANLPNGKKYEIIAYNHPIDRNQEQIDKKAVYEAIVQVFVSIFVIVALAFVPASFLVYLVEDRSSKSKHLQLVSGLNPVVYWVGSFAWDMVNYLLPATCIIIIFLAFNQDAYVSASNFPATLILLLLYGWAMTPLMYPFSFLFDVPSTAYIVLICGNLFVGIIGNLATFILDYVGRYDDELQSVNDVLKVVLLVFPNYSFGRGLIDLAGNQLQADIASRFGTTTFKNPFEWDIIGRNIFSMILAGCVYFTLTLLMQYRFFIRPWQPKITSAHTKTREEDVLKEEERTLDKSQNDNMILRAEKLSKVYRRGLRQHETLAVDGMSFGVKQGECFGLLGVNGAGKSTTFKMLTSDVAITSGDAYINGYSVRGDMNRARQFMGYCPQFDALDGLLTGKEMLTFYARVRGMNRNAGEKMANWAIETLGLSQYKDRPCGTYSGGNKRKLSTAIALLGSPPLIFLDEPTTGMDPIARRFLWNVLSSVIKAGKSVVLTSHCMEECETLCTRLAIMVNGEFQCIGSPQHLRSKFGTGYFLVIRAKPDGIEHVEKFVEENFVNAKLKARHQFMFEYHLPKDNLQLSRVFQKLESLRKSGFMEDYSVSQTTLDQIFVNFAREQVEAVSYDDDNSENVTVAINGDILMEECRPPDLTYPHIQSDVKPVHV